MSKTKNSSLENMKTTELINEFQTLPSEGNEWKDGGKYEQLMGELATRYPFQELLDKEWEGSLPFIVLQLEEIKEELKKLKRHKHDDKTGDVLIRI